MALLAWPVNHRASGCARFPPCKPPPVNRLMALRPDPVSGIYKLCKYLNSFSPHPLLIRPLHGCRAAGRRRPSGTHGCCVLLPLSGLLCPAADAGARRCLSFKRHRISIHIPRDPSSHLVAHVVGIFNLTAIPKSWQKNTKHPPPVPTATSDRIQTASSPVGSGTVRWLRPPPMCPTAPHSALLPSPRSHWRDEAVPSLRGASVPVAPPVPPPGCPRSPARPRLRGLARGPGRP
jgi:hypothetical protein